MRTVGSGYQLRTLIGHGSTGAVWAGATSDGRPVAIKILNGELTADPDAVARFVREGQILTSIRSPNLVWVHDLIAGGDTLGIVMDLVDGPDLHTYLREHGPVAPALAAELIGQVLGALCVVHRAGIIHRDIKPENILIDLSEPDRPRALLSDFGIAMITGDPAEDGTGLAGTLPYLAPELIQHGRASVSSDLYATGVVLYELLAGRAPFVSHDPYELIRAHQEDRPAPVPGLPAALQALIDGLLAKNPAARPPSATAARQLLTQAATGPAAEVPLPGLPPVGEGYRGPTIPPAGAVPIQPTKQDVADSPSAAAGFTAPPPVRPFDDADTAKLFTVRPAMRAPRDAAEHFGHALTSPYAPPVPLTAPRHPAYSPETVSAAGGLATAEPSQFGNGRPGAPVGAATAFAGGLFDGRPGTGEVLGPDVAPRSGPPGPPRRPADRDRWWMFPVGLGLAAVAGLIAVVFVISGGGSTPPATSSPTTGPSATVGADAPITGASVPTDDPVVEPTATTPAPSPTPSMTPSATAAASATAPPKPVTITMPRLTGTSLSAANAELSASGLRKASSSLTCSGSAPEGQVLSQSPPAGSPVTASTRISVTVQDDCAIVPNVRGRSLNAAKRELRAAGFTDIVSLPRNQADTRTATVVAQMPAPGTSRKTSTTVYLQVSTTSGGGGPG